MGFWAETGKLILKAGAFAFNQTREAGVRFEEYQKEMTFKTDKELFLLIKKEKTSSIVMVAAARDELQRRGHTSEDIALLTS